MSYDENAKKRVEAEPCRCVSCGACNGSGQMMVQQTRYPEEDLETCDCCSGTGIVEVCDRCELLEEMYWNPGNAKRFDPRGSM